MGQIPARSKYVNLVGRGEALPVTARTSVETVGDPPVPAVVVNLTLEVSGDMPCDANENGNENGNENSDGKPKPSGEGGQGARAERDGETPSDDAEDASADEAVERGKKPGGGGDDGDDASKGGNGKKGKGRQLLDLGFGRRGLRDEEEVFSSSSAAAPAAAPSAAPGSTATPPGSVSLVTYLFTAATSVPYGNASVEVPANGVKFNIEAYAWPFCGEDHVLRVDIDIKEGKPAREEVKFRKTKGKGEDGESRGPKRAAVEMEAGVIDVPEVAVVDGRVTAIASEATTRGRKRSVAFTFPRFEKSLVYDPVVRLHTDEEKEAFVAREVSEHDAELAAAGEAINNATSKNATSESDAGRLARATTGVCLAAATLLAWT